MAVDLTLLGNKLQRYRNQFQVSLQELSEATGIDIERLDKYEKGELTPTGDEILILSEYYKCDYKFFISNEKTAPFEETETLFRRYGNEFSREDRWRVQEFLFLCESEEYLMGFVRNTRSRVPFSFQKKSTFQKGNAREAAAQLRQGLGYAGFAVPRDVFSDFRNIGIHLFRRELTNSNISGLFVKHPTAGKCILVNYSEDVFRQRFTAAHEAAHAILDDEDDFVVSFGKWDRNDLREVSANEFAGHYLMPPEFLRLIPGSTSWNQSKFLEWAVKLRVNAEPLAIALKNAHLISSEEFSRFRSVKIPKSGKLDPELSEHLAPGTKARKEALLRRGLSSLYVHLCLEAYDNQHISAGRLAEVLLTDQRELPEIVHLFGRNLARGL